MKNMQVSLFQIYRFIGVLLVCVLLTDTINAQEKAEKRTNEVSVNLKVTDENGNPIPNAQVVVSEGIIRAKTDENGVISFKALANDFITISSSGYEKNVSLVEKIIADNTIKLKKSKLFMTSDDVIPLPFMTMKKRNITGSENVITGDQLDKYPSTDLRNVFTGLATGLEILEQNGSPGLNAEEKLGLYGASEKVLAIARGRSMKYIIDDVPTDITEMPLDPGEIESVTVIKDIVGKAMYGPAGADGIILITTKRGHVNERNVNVSIEDGVSVVDRMPEWVSGADYANLNNTARYNSGLTPLYSQSDIDTYAMNEPYDMYHPSVNFKDMMLKSTMAFRRANVSSSGGNDAVQYSAYVGYDGEGDIYKIGPTARYNRINARSNMDINVNEFIKVQLNFFGGLTYRPSPNYISTELITKLNPLLSDITTIPPIAFPVYANNAPTLAAPWYAVTSIYGSNPIGNLMKRGYYTDRGRMGSTSFALDYNMSSILKGLKSRTYFGLNAYAMVRNGKANDYIAYTATPSKSAKTGNDTIILSKVHDGVDQASESTLHNFFYNQFLVYENLSYEKSFGKNSIQTSLVYSITNMVKKGVTDPQKQQKGVWTGMYSYDNKYNIEGVLNYAGSYSFSKEQQYKFFPSIGASWVISEENFMSKLGFINYLKLRAEAGILGFDNFLTPFQWRDRWTVSTGTSFGPYSVSQWFGSSTDAPYQTTPARIGNSTLTWEKRKEFNVGLDALMSNQKLSLEVNYYNTLRDGVITQVSNALPFIAGVSSTLPYLNYNKIRYYGLETGILFTDNIGELKYSIGGNATIQNSKFEKFDEPAYRYDYQSMIGRPADALLGLVYLGKFGTDAETQVVPQLYDATLHAGDLKYKDMNSDGVVDDNDKTMIGHTDPRLFYALNAKISYKDFDLTIIGTGRAFYDIALTSQYYWNGWGDNNYSKFVKDNIGGTYPNLTYYKVNNNFQNSIFWLTNGGYFKIQNVEIAYNLPMNKLPSIGTRGIRVFVRGANLCTFSKVKDVDPESINSGVTYYPMFRTFSGGIKLTF